MSHFAAVNGGGPSALQQSPSARAPVISPPVYNLDVQLGSKLEISCTGKRPVDWKVPASSENNPNVRVSGGHFLVLEAFCRCSAKKTHLINVYKIIEAYLAQFFLFCGEKFIEKNIFCREVEKILFVISIFSFEKFYVPWYLTPCIGLWKDRFLIGFASCDPSCARPSLFVRLVKMRSRHICWCDPLNTMLFAVICFDFDQKYSVNAQRMYD